MVFEASAGFGSGFRMVPVGGALKLRGGPPDTSASNALSWNGFTNKCAKHNETQKNALDPVAMKKNREASWNFTKSGSSSWTAWTNYNIYVYI